MIETAALAALNHLLTQAAWVRERLAPRADGNLRRDHEEDLSRWIGDIAAHRVAGGIQAIDAWRRDAGERLRENLAEYAFEEDPLLVRAPDFAVHREEIAAFDRSLSQLEIRAAKLHR